MVTNSEPSTTHIPTDQAEDIMVTNSDSGSNTEQVDEATVSKEVWEKHFMCPITHEVPFEPVTAMDGFVYERAAIQEHIDHAESQGRRLKSPMTNKLMGPDLLASPQMKSLIELHGLKPTHPLLRKAMDGDIEAMFQVFCYYKSGTNGFKKDCKEAYHWAQKAHENAHVTATAALGAALLNGRLGDFVVPKCIAEGWALTGVAAQAGSNLAAFNLGQSYFRGLEGLPRDSKAAKRWLQKCLSADCSHSHLGEEARERARKMLDELENRAAE